MKGPTLVAFVCLIGAASVGLFQLGYHYPLVAIPFLLAITVALAVLIVVGVVLVVRSKEQ